MWEKFKKIIQYFKNSKIVYWLRCLIFGHNNVKKIDMENIDKLKKEKYDFKKKIFFETDINIINDYNNKINDIDNQINNIRKNQYKYIVRICSNLGYEKWLDEYFSSYKIEINKPINLSQSNISIYLKELKLELENYLIEYDLIDITSIKEIYIKRKN